MKIIVFTINPIYPDKVTGGASKHLYYITKFLGDQGHRVEILCPKSKSLKEHFDIHDRVTVYPELAFNLPFPQPYAISPPQLSMIATKIQKRLKGADRFYIHDGEWLIPDIYENIPTIISFRDNIYPETILGTFIGKPDDVICVSDYSRAVIVHTAGLLFPDLKNRLHTITNGIDFKLFKTVRSVDLEKRLNLNPKDDFIMLHPHRPEEGKGLAETIRVVNRLVNKHGFVNVKVLIPQWIDSMVSASDSNFYNNMMRLMQDLKVEENFKFIPWMPIDQMPELFSLGDVTMCLGNIVEAFGNVAYESLACGTPSLVSRVGVHRTLLSDKLIDKVHFGDIDDAVDRILSIIEGRDWDHQGVLKVLKEKMDINKQIESYSQIIINCQKRTSLHLSLRPFEKNQMYRISPWCYFKGDYIYHDYQGVYEIASQLAKFSQSYTNFSKSNALTNGISEALWEDWVEKTWIVQTLDF